MEMGSDGKVVREMLEEERCEIGMTGKLKVP